MCTALSIYKKKKWLFGRNLDLDYDFNQQVVITPRNFRWKYKYMKYLENKSHYAIIGMASKVNDYPLYADAMNEHGLCIAGLNFPGNSVYNEFEKKEGIKNIASFEIIQWILGNFKSVKKAKEEILNVNITNDNFLDTIPNAPLHWIVSDKEESITIEQTKNGLKVWDNEIDILTNNPTFDWQIENLNRYMGLSNKNHKGTNWEDIMLKPSGEGFGAIGLPGDYSPSSRFVKTAFLKANSKEQENELANVNELFHILSNVSMVRGSVILQNNKEEITIYSSCMSPESLTYYYKTYNNSQINAISLKNENIDGKDIIFFEYSNNIKLNKVN